MQRADRIGLIVASVLVVLLAAGGAFLLVQRNNVLANERPLDDAVKLTQLEDTSTAAPAEAATTTPAVQTKPVVPTRPKGYVFGYVTLVGGKSKAMYIKWDLAELLTGKEADVFAKKRGAVVNTQPYYIANDTKKLKTYDLPSTTPIVVTAADGSTSTITPAKLQQQFGTYKSRPWFIYVVDGVVRKMVDVVLPAASAQ